MMNYNTDTFLDVAELVVKFNKNNSNLPVNTENRHINSLVDYVTPTKKGMLFGLNITNTKNGQTTNELVEFKNENQLLTFLKENA